MKTRQLAFANEDGSIFLVTFDKTVAYIETEFGAYSTEDVVELFIQLGQDVFTEELTLLGAL